MEEDEDEDEKEERLVTAIELHFLIVISILIHLYDLLFYN